MNDTIPALQQERVYDTPPKRAPGKTSNKKRTYFMVGLSIVLWGSLLYGGYWLTNLRMQENTEYIDARIGEIEAQNHMEINDIQTKLEEVHTELLNVKNELVIIQEDLSLTGETLDGTDKTKVALQDRIDQLNVQLKELEASIERLEDAAN